MSVKTPGSKFLAAGMDAKLKGNSSTGVTGMDFSTSLTAGVGVANAKLTAGISVGENEKLTGVTSLILETPLGDIPIAEGEVGSGSLDPNAWLEDSGILVIPHSVMPINYWPAEVCISMVVVCPSRNGSIS